MSTLPDERQLEEDFRALLGASLGGTIALRTTNDLATSEARPMPMVGIKVTKQSDSYATTNASHRGTEVEIRFEVRVDGAPASSEATVESIAAQIAAAIEAGGESYFVSWDVVDAIESTGHERGFDAGARVLALVYSGFVLRSV